MNTGQVPLTPASIPLASTNKEALKFVANWEHQVKRAKILMKNAQHRQMVLFSKKVQDKSFSVGDQVMLSTRNFQFKGKRGERSKKFAPKYMGPFTIVEKVGKVAYKLELPPSMQVHPVFHVSLLKDYRLDPRYAPPAPIIDFIDGETHYQMEAIVGERKFGRKKLQQYEVKWVGDDVTTWEFESDLFQDSPEFAPVLVEAYRATKQNRVR
jgi:hypothetical protein